MNYLKSLIYSLMIVLVLSQCAKTNGSENTNESLEKEQISFVDFFEKFSKEEEYQTDNITFPLPYYSYDIEDELSESTIQKSQWEFEDFSGDKSAKNKTVDAYEVVIDELSPTEIKYTRLGIDNGIRIEYYFQAKGKTWSLVKIEGKSN